MLVSHDNASHDNTGPTAIGFDSISFLYQGINAGSPDQRTAPSPCASFVASADTGDIQALVLSGISPGNYTVVLTTYSSSFPGRSNFILYAMNGQFIFDYIPIVTTGLITTGSITTGMTSGTIYMSFQFDTLGQLTTGSDITSGYAITSGGLTTGLYIPFTTGT